MKIIYASDIHTNREHIGTLLQLAAKADTLIIGGDIVPKEVYSHRFRDGAREALKAQKEYLKDEFVPALKDFASEFPSKRIFLDLGNDDFRACRPILEEHDGRLFHLLHMAKHALTPEVDIIGYMCVPPTPFGIKDWEKPDAEAEPIPGPDGRPAGIRSSGDDIEKAYLDLYGNDTIEADLERLSAMVDKPFIFVAHSPPYGTPLDMLYSMLHAGSWAVRKFSEKWAKDGRLIGSFHGHIHESPAVSGTTWIKIKDAICVNPGQTELDLKFFECRIINGKIVSHENPFERNDRRSFEGGNDYGRTPS